MTKNKAVKITEAEEGFTLLEVIVVIAIIGILISLALVSYGSVTHTARQNGIDEAARKVGIASMAAISDDDPATTVTSAVAAYNAQTDDIFAWAEFHTGDPYVDNTMVDGQSNFVILTRFESPIQRAPYEYGKFEVRY